MTIYEYYQLSQREQLDILYNEGIFLGKRRKEDAVVLLYQLNSFYVEVFYKKYRRVVEKLKCFHSIDLLEPYLEQIDVDELIKYVE